MAHDELKNFLNNLFRRPPGWWESPPEWWENPPAWHNGGNGGEEVPEGPPPVVDNTLPGDLPRPDNTLPGDLPGAEVPGEEVPEGPPPVVDNTLPGDLPYPDNTLPVPPGEEPPPEVEPPPGEPVEPPVEYPDQTLPGDLPYPDNTLPGEQPYPDNTLPGDLPGSEEPPAESPGFPVADTELRKVKLDEAEPLTGTDIRSYQRLLEDRGFSPGELDGMWGPQSDAALRAFQAAQGIEVDGIIGPFTLKRLIAGYPAV